MQQALRLVIAAFAAIALAQFSTSASAQTEAKQVKGQVNQLLSGVPQAGTVLGSPSAPVTMVYYGDLQCPVCKDFTESGGFPELVDKDVRSGKVKVVYRSFQTATPDPSTFRTQQAAALAAGKQNHFWDYVELFYHQQGTEGTSYVNNAFLTGLAQQISGLNLSQWRTERTNPSLLNHVVSEGQQGAAAGVRATPTLVMEGPKGKSQVPQSVPSYAELQQAIQSVA